MKPSRRAAPSRARRTSSDDVDAGAREPYLDAELYDYEYRNRRDDVAFYRRLADACGGPILDLGAGSGRVAIALARDGHEVVALDSAPMMLRQLRSKVASLPVKVAERIAVVQGDLRAFAIPAAVARRHGKRFPLAIAAFNVVEHLYTRGEVAACLAYVASHLAPDGRFAFDVQVPDLGWLTRDPTKRWAKTRFTHPVTKRPMVYSTNHDYDPVGQIATIRLFYDPADGRGRGRVVRLSQRKFFPAELEALVAHAGFRVAERFGDFFGGPLDRRSQTQILICEAVGARRYA